MAKAMSKMPFGGKMAKPFGGKEKGKEEKMEKKMGKKAYMAGEAKEKKMGVTKMGAYKSGGMVKGRKGC
jgi:hypothetical protein